jgi:CBS domain-containing protein
VGNLSFYAVMQHIADRLVRMLPDDSVQTGLRFVDFTGLNTAAAVVVSVTDTVEVAAHQMKARGIGSVMVVDDRDNLVGVLTEFDLQQKIGCDRADLDVLAVADYMTADPVALRARAPISDAVRNMAKYRFSHVPLLGESGRPVGVASFRDIATYVEASLAAG